MLCLVCVLFVTMIVVCVRYLIFVIMLNGCLCLVIEKSRGIENVIDAWEIDGI